MQKFVSSKLLHTCNHFQLTKKIKCALAQENRGSYMSAHVLLNLLHKFVKRDKMRGLPTI